MTVVTYTTGQPGLLASHRMMPRDRDSMERVRGSEFVPRMWLYCWLQPPQHLVSRHCLHQPAGSP